MASNHQRENSSRDEERTQQLIGTNSARSTLGYQMGLIHNTSTTMTRKFHYHLYTSLLLLTFMSVVLFRNVILAHVQHGGHRCSHLPPPPVQVQHIWLEPVETNSTYLDPHDNSSAPFIINENGQSRGANLKSKRHIERAERNLQRDGRSLELPPDDSVQDTLRNLLKKMERLSWPSASHNDLVPMKIQVYYDQSVYMLDKQKLDLIHGTVIPTVVKSFESVLSIRRDYTIDKFRISRKCPNNTIYYARDVVGLSRPYCMDRCEDHAVCGEMVVPREHLSACSYCNITSRRCTTNYTSEGAGVANTQLLLYVSAKQTVRCKKDQTIAYAAHCAQDTKTDRPVAGHANLCPSSISTDPRDLKALIATVKHELTHVLGFSVSLFAYYRDENGQPLTEREAIPGPIPVDAKTGYAKWSERVIRKVMRPQWVTGEGLIDKEVHLMVTPTVVREVRRHFNCSSLEGAELEDQGFDGTSMTHWEKRLFENEAMTGTHTQNSVYSRITLAALQDTGWYVANFSRAERLDWGKDLGCDFVKKSCKSWIDERRAKQMSIRPYCDRVKGDLLKISCTEDRYSKAVCNMRQYKEPLPPMYQNFDRLEGIADDQSLAFYGGAVDLADYCPFIQEFTWQAQNVTVRGSRCDMGGSLDSERNAALEHYGLDARCFEHGRRWEQRSCIYKRHWHHHGAGCYSFTCSNGHLQVVVGNHTYTCYYPEQSIHIEQIVDQWLYNGTLSCPACDKICPAHRCKHYDKHLIDKILSYDHHSGGESISQEEMLREILDETFNLIDTTKSTQGADKSKLLLSSKYKNFLTTNTSDSIDDLTIKRYLKYKENLTRILASHKRPPRHTLLCSGAPHWNLGLDQNFAKLLLMISLIVSTVASSSIIIPRLNQ